MSTRINYLFALLIFTALLLSSSLYIVQEGQQGILEQLGQIARDQSNLPKVFEPGLHWKWPFVNRARIFDTRLQTLFVEVGRRDVNVGGGYQQNSRIVTKEKKDVIVDYYVKWKIVNLAHFLTSTQGNYAYAENLLTRIISDSLRAEFGKRTITEVVSGERDDIMSILRNKAVEPADDLGIKVIDVRIKKIDLPEAVSQSVYQRMRTEREKKANEHRARGKSEAEKIRAKIDRAVIEIIAKANSDAKKILGEGDAISARIYATAYKNNPDFYDFYRSLQAYRNSFQSKSDVLLLQPEDNMFFKYFSMGDRLNKNKMIYKADKKKSKK